MIDVNIIDRYSFENIHINLIFNNKINSPNSGCLLNIGTGPESGPRLYSEAKGRKGAHQFIMGPRAAKWLIIV